MALVRRIGLAALLVVAIVFAIAASYSLEAGSLRATAALPLPQYLVPMRDPTFGTEFMRITRPGHAWFIGTKCHPKHCRHRYSSIQAWNADQSLLLITEGCAGFCFLDGRTFEPRFRRSVSGRQDCKWHPRDPEQMVCVHPDGIALWQPRTNTWRSVYRPSAYGSIAFGPYKGNLSFDGTMIALRARKARIGLVAFAYNLRTGQKHPDISLDALEGENQYASISPSGRYVYVAQMTTAGREPSYIFQVDGKLIQHWPEHHRPGHGDMTVDADGADVYVGISKADPDKYHVIKRRLVDGAVTDLLPYGNATHVSARNIQWRGWVFVTYQGSYLKTMTYAYPSPYYQEVIAVRIDGSGALRRLAHTYGVDHEYLSESHASPSPDGSQVVWASNWGSAGGPISDFVTKWTPPTDK